LQAAGLTFVESSAWKTGGIPEDRRRTEYTISPAELPMQLERWQTADMLTSLHEGPNKVRLPIPTDFPTRLSWVGMVTAVVGGLPKLFPCPSCWRTPGGRSRPPRVTGCGSACRRCAIISTSI
jgi:hypothetical protein